MKILEVNNYYYNRGGSENVFLQTCDLLGKNGHNVVVFSTDNSRNISSSRSAYFTPDIDFNKFSFKNILHFFYNFRAVRDLKKLIEKEKPDIAHLHNIYHHLSPAIIRTLKKNNIPVVMTLHDYKIVCPNYRLFSQNKLCQDCNGGKYYNCFLKKCVKNSYAKSFLASCEAYLHSMIGSYEKVDLFIAPSKFMRNVCVQFGVPAEKIKVIYNPFEAVKNTGVSTINKLDALLYFGRLSDEKGIAVLLLALRALSNTRLKIVGEGDARPELEKLAREYGISERVEFCGAKYGNDLQTEINMARAIIMPSALPENMPLALLESMSAGKVVIASNSGGFTEMIQDGVNGLLFNTNDAEDLVRAIKRLDGCDLEKMGEIAKNKAEAIMAEDYYGDLYESFLSNNM